MYHALEHDCWLTSQHHHLFILVLVVVVVIVLVVVFVWLWLLLNCCCCGFCCLLRGLDASSHTIFVSSGAKCCTIYSIAGVVFLVSYFS